jgi:hypothetical protein
MKVKKAGRRRLGTVLMNLIVNENADDLRFL